VNERTSFQKSGEQPVATGWEDLSKYKLDGWVDESGMIHKGESNGDVSLTEDEEESDKYGPYGLELADTEKINLGTQEGRYEYLATLVDNALAVNAERLKLIEDGRFDEMKEEERGKFYDKNEDEAFENTKYSLDLAKEQKAILDNLDLSDSTVEDALKTTTEKYFKRFNELDANVDEAVKLKLNLQYDAARNLYAILVDEVRRRRKDAEPQVESGREAIVSKEQGAIVGETRPENTPLTEQNNKKNMNKAREAAAKREQVIATMKSETGQGKETSTGEAAREYMDILLELGQDFTGAEVRANKTPDGKHISTKMDGFIGKFGGDKATEYADNNKVLQNVVKIIEAKNSEQAAMAQIAELSKKLDELESARSSTGALKKLFGRGAYNREKKMLLEKREWGKEQVALAKHRMDAILGDSYLGLYGRGHTERDSLDSHVEELRAKFFSEEKMAKIRRAMELQKKYFSKIS
jgi:hypothetical protein